MFAASAAPAAGHLVHLVALGVWLAVVAAVLLIDHLRGNRWRTPDGDEAEPSRTGDDPAIETTPMPVSMATWPPRPYAPTRARRRRPSRSPLPSRVSLRVAALGSLTAAGVHLFVMPEHFDESLWYGSFFAALAAAQLGYATLLVRRCSPPVLRAGVAANGAVIALWAFTRMVEVPLGPGRGETEPVGMLDVVASSAELVVLLGCGFALLMLHTVATGVSGEPTAPGSRSGGAVSKNRLRPFARSHVAS